tara:strand:+ start:2951 stop:3130 length:180 start_codon:yes stop_codon:yes gene_type:complete
MQPKLLFMKLNEILSVAKKETVFDQYDPGGLPWEPRMILEQLMWKYEQIQFFAPSVAQD